jgi:hypothetical protein
LNHKKTKQTKARSLCYLSLFISGLPTTTSNEQTSAPNSAFHRFTSNNMAAPTATSASGTTVTSLTTLASSSSNHNNVKNNFEAGNSLNLVSNSPNNRKSAASLEPGSSPTSSTASDSHSPPTVRKRSKGRTGEKHQIYCFKKLSPLRFTQKSLKTRINFCALSPHRGDIVLLKKKWINWFKNGLYLMGRHIVESATSLSEFPVIYGSSISSKFG